MSGKIWRSTRGWKLGGMFGFACVLAPMLTGCGPELVGFGSISAIYISAIITTPLRSIVGNAIRQFVISN